MVGRAKLLLRLGLGVLLLFLLLLFGVFAGFAFLAVAGLAFLAGGARSLVLRLVGGLVGGKGGITDRERGHTG
jgi:hypothetical protein